MATEGKPDTEDFVITRVFNAPRQRVWEAWANPDKLAQWFGPQGVTTTVKAHDLRPGGVLHSRMDMPNAEPMWAKFVYRDVVAPSRLVWVHSFSDEHAAVTRAPFFDGNWPLELLSTLTFAEDGTGTRLTLSWMPLNASDVESQTFAANKTSMHHGWTGSFDRLDAFLAAA